MIELIGIGLAWVAYGWIHSWLASDAAKRAVAVRWPRLAPAYRLAYNGLALFLLLPPLWLTWHSPGAPLWHWPAWIAWPALLLAVAGYAWSMAWYDGMDFIGLRQWRQDAPVPERLSISPLHRHVRHPWYALGLLVIWTRDLNPALLVAALVVTLYLIVGSRLEERKLEGLYGDAYRRYRERVPGLLPWPGRSLNAAEAGALVAAADAARRGARPD